MSADFVWQELYQAALLELRPGKLQQRIDAAERAIHERIAELSRGEPISAHESQALEDAQRGLRVLATTECQAQRSHSDLAENEAAS